MMVKILREGAQLGSLRREGAHTAQLGSLRRQRGGFGSEKEALASLRSDSGTTVGGLSGSSDWERLSQWDPPRGSFAGSFEESSKRSFEELSKRSERRPERSGKRQYRSPWVKSRIW